MQSPLRTAGHAGRSQSRRQHGPSKATAAALSWFALALATLLPWQLADAQEAWPSSHPDGPVWIENDLYWAEMRSGRVMRMRDDGHATVYEDPDCGPTAIAPFGTEGDLITLCYQSGLLIVLDPSGKVRLTYSTASDGTALRHPKDAVADGQGGIWFTDPGEFSSDLPAEGRLYHLSAAGEISLVKGGLAYGSGLHLDQGGQRLLLAEHFARRVLAFPLAPSGIGPAETLFLIDSFDIPRPVDYPASGPAGLSLGPDGTLWLAEYGARRLLGWQPERGLVAALQVDTQFVTGIAFGPDGWAAMTGVYHQPFPHGKGAVWLLTPDEHSTMAFPD